MKIEVLYFDGCPNRAPAVERLREVLKEEGLTVETIEINVTDQATAQAVEFLGSPTIRIDGLDVEASARSSRTYGMTCRTYLNSGKREGVPSRDVIRSAIKEALAKDSRANECCQPPLTQSAAENPEKANRPGVLMASSIVAAILASFCCILPIVFALTGFTAIGAAAVFAEWRPFLLAVTFGLLGLGFYFAYRPAKRNGGPSGVCTMPAPRLQPTPVDRDTVRGAACSMAF